jgi:hypothetical protein
MRNDSRLIAESITLDSRSGGMVIAEAAAKAAGEGWIGKGMSAGSDGSRAGIESLSESDGVSGAGEGASLFGGDSGGSLMTESLHPHCLGRTTGGAGYFTHAPSLGHALVRRVTGGELRR